MFTIAVPSDTKLYSFALNNVVKVCTEGFFMSNFWPVLLSFKSNNNKKKNKTKLRKCL